MSRDAGLCGEYGKGSDATRSTYFPKGSPTEHCMLRPPSVACPIAPLIIANIADARSAFGDRTTVFASFAPYWKALSARRSTRVTVLTVNSTRVSLSAGEKRRGNGVSVRVIVGITRLYTAISRVPSRNRLPVKADVTVESSKKTFAVQSARSTSVVDQGDGVNT